MSTLKQQWFLSKVPGKPMGRYAHIVTIRATDSYPLFPVSYTHLTLPTIYSV